MTETAVITEVQTSAAGTAVEPERVRTWVVPAADVLEKDGDLRLRLDVPGVTRERVQLDVIDGVLTLTAQRADVPEKGWRRRFRLPEHVDVDAVSATLTNGVLTIDLPRRAETRPRRIEVH